MAPLKPIGFWSYTSRDDAASDGQLSQLRRLLANHLQIRVGRDEVYIFQDVTAIPPGMEWEQQIGQALDKTSFFIPVMTPGFMQSEWCCKEVTKFREIMQRRGRTDLVIPIHYLDVSEFQAVRRSECYDPDTLSYLQTLQWTDFRRLRLRDPKSEDVRQALDTVAIAIVSALYRDNRLPESAEPQRPGALSELHPIAIPAVAETIEPRDPFLEKTKSAPDTIPPKHVPIWKMRSTWLVAVMAMLIAGTLSIGYLALSPSGHVLPPIANNMVTQAPRSVAKLLPQPTPTVVADLPKETRDICPKAFTCPALVLIPQGNFDMGATLEEQDREKVPDLDRARERPKHQVHIGYDFYMAKYAVTVAQFRAFAKAKALRPAGGCWSFEQDAEGKYQWRSKVDRTWENPGFTQSDNDPVVCVSYDDAVAFVDWLNSVTGKNSYHLPSEAEWEYAARAGTGTARFWGDSRANACQFANASDQALAKQWNVTRADTEKFFACDDRFPFTAPVGAFQPNQFGLYDMLGNALQWTSDCWIGDYKNAPTDGSPHTAMDCGLHAVRGGSWGDYPWSIRSSARFRNPNGERDTGTGLRVARAP